MPFARPWLVELTTRATDRIGEAPVERLWRTGTTLPRSVAVDRAIHQLSPG